MKRLVLIPLFFIYFSGFAQVVYNAYAKVTNISGTTFTVSDLTEPASYSFAASEKIIIMQMQDNVIGANTNNNATFGDIGNIQSAGLWEEITLSSIVRSGTNATVTLASNPTNTYNIGTNSSVQIITLRRLSATAFTTTNNITGTAWNGNIGGVVAIEVGTDLTLQHSISANALGFRGGSFSNNHSGATCTAPSATVYIINDNQRGFKGEGIYKSTDVSYSNARGKIANGGGGGNHHNGGGGGGGNWTAGGLGGNGYNNCTANPGGGLGGLSLSSYIVNNRIFMGGGGGGGQRNNSTGSNGGRGGGIVIIKADRVLTGATCGSPINISANGETAASGNNDGQGGGGAAGTVVLKVNSFSLSATCPVTISANGGNGGRANDGAAHAGGGSGAQGIVVFSAAQPTSNATTQTNNGTPGCNNNSNPCNNSAGSASGTNGSGILPNIGGGLPVELIQFDAKKQGNHVLLTWTTASETNNDFFTIERSEDAITFIALENIKSKAKNGNSKNKLSYFAKDFKPINGINYYRIAQTDFNGTHKKHYTISLYNTENDPSNFNYVVYPNPNKGSFNIQFDGIVNKENVLINLFDVSGKLLKEETFELTPQNTWLNYQPDVNLSEGMYFLSTTYMGITRFTKIIVQK